MDKPFQDYLTHEIKELKTQVAQVRIDIAGLKIRSSFWGGITGLGAAMGVVVWKLLS